MNAVKDSSHLYEVERRARHAERPGFRISELQISPTQQVPWHYHTRVQDTFYVLRAASASSSATPRKRCGSRRARPIRSGPGGRTSSPTQARPPRPSSCCRGSASTTTCRWSEPNPEGSGASAHRLREAPHRQLADLRPHRGSHFRRVAVVHAVEDARESDLLRECADARPRPHRAARGVAGGAQGRRPGPTRSPRRAPRRATPDTMQWAHGYSGCMGVSMKGVHPASRSVASLPSVSPLRMAVTGRQKLYVYLASKTAMSASSMAMAATAKKRALSVTSRPGAAATERAIGQ